MAVSPWHGGACSQIVTCSCGPPAKTKGSRLPRYTQISKLAARGGYLALLDLTGNIASSFNPYPPQSTDVSYGRDRADLNAVGFFRYPTPGSQNVNGLPPPSFSHESGIYTNATISVVMSSAGGYLYYTLDGSLPTTNSMPYTGPITIGTNVTVKARVFPASLAGELPSDVAARNFVFLDNTTADFNSNLPLIIISTEGRPIPLEVPSGGNRTKGSFSIFDVRNARSSPKDSPHLQVLAGFEFFGQTAIGFPKKPIRVETQDAYGNDLKVSILGLPPGSDYRLRNPYNDKTFLNDFLSTELYEQMGQYSVRRRFVEAFVDTGGGRLNYTNDYYGIMVLFEGIQIDQTRLDLARIPVNATDEPSISGGYIFKKDKDTAGDLDFSTTGGNGFPAQSLKMHDPKPNDLRVAPITGPLTAGGTAQVNYLRRYLNSMEQAMYAPNWLSHTGTNHYSHYLDLDSFVNLHWMTEFAKYVDGHRISTFFYKDRGGKVSAGPIWGWNLGFGNANFMLAGQTNGWYYEQLGAAEHGWMRRLIDGSPGVGSNLIGDPEFVQKVADRWGELRTNVFNPNRVLPRIDELATYLSDATARDFTKYPRLGQYLWAQPDGGVSTGTSAGSIDGRDVDFVRPLVYHDGTVNSIIGQMKRFIHDRYRWLDSQFTPPPVIHAAGGLVTNGFSVTITAKPGAQIYYTLDGTDPRSSGGITNGLLYTGPILVNANVKIVARARELHTWKNTWSGRSEATLHTTIPALRITEIMYHPTDGDGSPAPSSNFEYIEVRNIGDELLNVNGFSLTGGIQFQFPALTLSAGQSAVVVNNMAAFQARYGLANPAIVILGEFSGPLSDAGDQIILKGPLGEPILNFAYQDAWYPTTDGLGFSLVVKDAHSPVNTWGLESHWRPSSQPGGSPGQADLSSTLPRLLISEALANSASGADAIEVLNDSDAPIDISGWFLSDDFRTPKKYLIPSNTIVAPHGFYVFYETNAFNSPTNAATAFGLEAQGDDVWIFSGDGTNLTGYAHGFAFGASPAGRTFGRHIISTGAEHFSLQAANSLGTPNSSPAVGPIVITEINAHPPSIGVNGLPYDNTGDEYIEIQNISAANVPLYLPTAPSNTWQLKGTLAFTFPSTNVVIPPGGFILLVGFDPSSDSVAIAAFRERNGVPANVPIFGPWTGTLNNTNGILELSQPDIADVTGAVTYYVADRVRYSSDAPWPGGWAGSGLTLQKISPAGYSDDPLYWAVLPRNPGALGMPTGTPPVITAQPNTQVVPTGRNLNLSVAATGTDLRYQWQRNGLNLPGATNSLLVISNFQIHHTGPYNILVYNTAGSALGEDFSLSARTGLQFLQNPLNLITTNGGTTNFSVSAVGTGPVRYQWKLNGADVQATNVVGADLRI